MAPQREKGRGVPEDSGVTRVPAGAHEGAIGTERDVNWAVDDMPMQGTLVAPPGDGPFPGVLLIAGSGPTDRNWNTPLLPGTNGSARLLAQALAEAGFASLRFDKRASGPNVRELLPRMIGTISMRSHHDEVAAAMRALVSTGLVRRDRLFAVGNSEGTLHALYYQGQSPEHPLAGLVLVAPPGRSVGAVARSQIAAQLLQVPNGDDILAKYDEAIARFTAGEEVAPDPSLPPGIVGLLQGLTTPANLPFTRELWTTDGASLLQGVNVPVLVLIGKKDIQVDWQVDGKALQLAAAEKPNVAFIFPEDANHVLKHEARARGELNAATAATYNADDATLDDVGTRAIIEWLGRQVK